MGRTTIGAKLLEYIQLKYGLSELAIELLDVNGFHTIEKMKEINESVINHLNEFLVKHMDTLNHVKEYFDENSTEFSLKYADELILASLPEKISNDLKGKKAKAFSITETYIKKKRAREEDDENETTNPPKKIKTKATSNTRKLSGSAEELEEIFVSFLQKHFGEEIDPNDVSFDERNKKFTFTCSTCGTGMIIGYIVTAKGRPSFINTNLLKHKCVTKKTRKILQERNNNNKNEEGISKNDTIDTLDINEEVTTLDSGFCDNEEDEETEYTVFFERF